MNINHLTYLASVGSHLPRGAAFLLLYLGPETIMPMASIIAAILGFLLIFWRVILKGLKKVFSPILTRFRKSSPAEMESAQSPAETLEENQEV